MLLWCCKQISKFPHDYCIISLSFSASPTVLSLPFVTLTLLPVALSAGQSEILQPNSTKWPKWCTSAEVSRGGWSIAMTQRLLCPVLRFLPSPQLLLCFVNTHRNNHPLGHICICTKTDHGCYKQVNTSRVQKKQSVWALGENIAGVMPFKMKTY